MVLGGGVTDRGGEVVTVVVVREGEVRGGVVGGGGVTGAPAIGEQEREKPFRLMMPSEVILIVREGVLLVKRGWVRRLPENSAIGDDGQQKSPSHMLTTS